MNESTADQAQAAEPVSFGEKLASSAAFANLFRDGMALVEETAAYLDGPGRQGSKKLERGAALAYATESMRLTTRLMQLASWLLLHRAVKEGEMTLSQANKEKSKVKLSVGEPGDLFDRQAAAAAVARSDRALTQAQRSSAPARRQHLRALDRARPGRPPASPVAAPARSAQGRHSSADLQTFR